MTGRLTAIEANRERLASLGTMAAGLAHELNNPAAAARRTATQLTEALDAIGSALGSFVEAGVEREDAERLVELQREAVAHAAQATALDALDASDAEEELLGRLQALDVEEPWRLAEPLAAAGVDQRWLDRVAELAGPATGAALRWVAATLTAGRLAAELEESTERMSALVGAVKSYAYMDRGNLVEVDLHEGLETTLTVLGYKLKHTEIAVARDYDRTLPQLTVWGSELNQVWTNLLDNAIDALGERGTITISTRADGELRGGRDRRRRPRRPGGPGGTDLRPVLHHQGRGTRDGPRPGHRTAHRRGPPRRLAHPRPPPRPHHLPRAAALHPHLTGRLPSGPAVGDGLASNGDPRPRKGWGRRSQWASAAIASTSRAGSSPPSHCGLLQMGRPST